MREIAVSAAVVIVAMLTAAPVPTVLAQGPPQGVLPPDVIGKLRRMLTKWLGMIRLWRVINR